MAIVFVSLAFVQGELFTNSTTADHYVSVAQHVATLTTAKHRVDDVTATDFHVGAIHIGEVCVCSTRLTITTTEDDTLQGT